MQVIIPHQNEIQKLINFQKKIIKDNFKANLPLIRIFPLWIEYSQETEINLKGKIKNIREIKILPPEVSKNSSSTVLPEAFKNSELFVTCPVEITDNTSVIKSELPILCTLPSHSAFGAEQSAEKDKISLYLKKISTEENIFPLCLKIFRSGNAVQVSASSTALENCIWKKLK